MFVVVRTDLIQSRLVTRFQDRPKSKRGTAPRDGARPSRLMAGIVGCLSFFTRTWEGNDVCANHGRLPKGRFGSRSMLPLHRRGVRSVQSEPRRTIAPRQSGLRRGIDDVLDRRLQHLPRRPTPAHHRADDQAHDRRRGNEQYAHGQLRRGHEGGTRCVAFSR